MAGARRRLAAALAALWWASAGAADSGLLTACAGQAPAGARGIAALEAACPGVQAALQEQGLAAHLPSGWQESLDAESLGALARLHQRYQDQPQRQPDPTVLPGILQQLASEQAEPRRTLWQMAMDWLRTWLGQQEGGKGSWLDDLLERLGQSRDLIRVVTYVLLAIVLVAVIALVVHELRAHGVLSRRRTPVGHGDAAQDIDRKARDPRLQDLDAAALHEQPALLLRLLVAQLMARGALQAERSLTHRELVEQARLPDADSRARFARVSRTAERARYAAGTLDPAQAREVIADGRALLLQWQGTTSPPA